MQDIYFKAVTLRRLHGLVESGIFAVPELQREFVWNARKVCDLLDSVFHNYPIGTILIWKAERRYENQLRKHYHILPHFDPENTHIYFLIDGQQRLSVLWHLLRGEGTSVVNEQGAKLNFSAVYFDPYAHGSETLFVYREHVTRDLRARLVPVVDLLSANWKRRTRGHKVRATRRLEECRRRILSYQALLVFCETKDRSEVRETFVRINSLGMRIGAADRAFARASTFDMRGMVRDIQTRLKNGFARVSRKTVLQTFAAALGIRDLGERAIKVFISRLETDEAERAKFVRVYPNIREAITMAADHLVHELGVPNFDFLPSEPMLMILSLYFFHNGTVRPPLAAKQRLTQWFWATGVGARYSGRGYRPNLTSDIGLMSKLAANPKTKLAFKVKLRVQTLRDTEYGRRGPVSNSFFCLLRLNKPRYLDSGSPIPEGDTSSRRNSSDKHHIFPRALLSRNGIGPERFNSILNICYLVARDNRSVGQRAPRAYFDDVPSNRRVLGVALRSHLIPSNAGKGIWDRSIKRGFKQFLIDRASLLARTFENQAGMKMFDRSEGF